MTRLGLWGTSFAGGHVLCIARQQGTGISAVVSQARRCCWHVLRRHGSARYPCDGIWRACTSGRCVDGAGI